MTESQRDHLLYLVARMTLQISIAQTGYNGAHTYSRQDLWDNQVDLKNAIDRLRDGYPVQVDSSGQRK